jgi:hypothetical protein
LKNNYLAPSYSAAGVTKSMLHLPVKKETKVSTFHFPKQPICVDGLLGLVSLFECVAGSLCTLQSLCYADAMLDLVIFCNARFTLIL